MVNWAVGLWKELFCSLTSPERKSGWLMSDSFIEMWEWCTSLLPFPLMVMIDNVTPNAQFPQWVAKIVHVCVYVCAYHVLLTLWGPNLFTHCSHCEVLSFMWGPEKIIICPREWWKQSCVQSWICVFLSCFLWAEVFFLLMHHCFNCAKVNIWEIMTHIISETLSTDIKH